MEASALAGQEQAAKLTRSTLYPRPLDVAPLQAAAEPALPVHAVVRISGQKSPEICYNRSYMADKNLDNRKRIPLPVRRSLARSAEHLVAWRKLTGLTQAQLADRAGVAERTVRRLEEGDGGVSTENLFRILRGLGLIDVVPNALDPYESDLGRARSDESLPARVRPRALKRSSQ